MALPIKTKTWVYSNNNTVTMTGGTEAYQQNLFSLKSALVTGGFVVEASSDSVTAKQLGDANPDLWINYTKVIRSSGNHSWIVLYHATMKMSFYISCDFSTGDYATAYVVSGHVNATGSISAGPTWSGNHVKFPSQSYTIGGGSATQLTWHLQYSNDGQCVRYICRSNHTSPGCLILNFQVPSNTPDLWINPLYVFYHNNSASSSLGMEASELYRTKTNNNILVNGSWYNAYLSSESFEDGDLPLSLMSNVSTADLSSAHDHLLCPIGIVGNDVGVRGSLGSLDDAWWRPMAMGIGDTLPDNASRSFICWPDMVWPWDGSVPVLG